MPQFSLQRGKYYNSRFTPVDLGKTCIIVCIYYSFIPLQISYALLPFNLAATRSRLASCTAFLPPCIVLFA